ncbi:MAG: ECF-type sigma factor [Acidobacteriota bacterium]
MTASNSITGWLRGSRLGDEEAFNQLVAAVYEDLRRLARRQSRGATLDTTALVHEAYLKLAASEALTARDRGHFLAVASRAMRQIFVDYARAKRRDKRGGGAAHTGLDHRQLAAPNTVELAIAVDQALSRLADERPRLVQIVDCRWFAGLSEAETAEALDVSISTVQREWREAKRILRAEMAGESGGAPE